MFNLFPLLSTCIKRSPLGQRKSGLLKDRWPLKTLLIHIVLSCSIYIHWLSCQTCIKRSPLGQRKVVSYNRFNSYFIVMCNWFPLLSNLYLEVTIGTKKKWSFKTDDLLKHVQFILYSHVQFVSIIQSNLYQEVAFETWKGWSFKTGDLLIIPSPTKLRRDIVMLRSFLPSVRPSVLP